MATASPKVGCTTPTTATSTRSKMAEEILFETLEGNIPLQEVLTWISNDTCGSSLQEKLTCSRGDFVLCILNFLRQSTTRAWVQSSFQSPMKSVAKLTSSSSSARHPPSQRPSVKRCARRIELFPKPDTLGISKIDDDQNNLLVCKAESYNDSNRTQSPSNFKGAESAILVTETNGPVTSSPFSTSMTSDNSPQFTPVNKRIHAFKSGDRRSPPVSNHSPDYQFKTPTRGNNVCLGDFLIKGGKSSQSKKRLSQSPPVSPLVSPLVSQNSSPVDDTSCNSLKRKQRRRINPTKVSLESALSSPPCGFQKTQPFGSTSQSVPETSPFQASVSLEPIGVAYSFSEERNLLKQERLKLQNQGENAISQNTVVSSTASSKSIVPKMLVIADPLKVTKREQLLKISDMYCCIINANLIPNLMSELYFIISLLVIRTDLESEENENAVANLEDGMVNVSLEQIDQEGTANDSASDFSSPVKKGKTDLKKECRNEHFHSVHNCVFFATQVLSKLVDVVGDLDRTTLKLLLDSERISVFSPALKDCLHLLYSNSVSRAKAPLATGSTKVVANVSFQSDTDNSSNFPSAQCFSNFRKQRDGFYELLSVWEANHLKPGWSFVLTLGNRVRSLVHLCSDPVNLMHFAKLFRLQLVSTVIEGSNSGDDGNEDLQFLEELKGVDPGKLNRLRGRLVTSYKAKGPRPAPSFPGQEEFYRDFIISSCHSSFIQHLQDSLISHLLELDQTSFLASETEDSELSVDSNTRQNYLSCVVTMRLLAKFLGLLVFLPYSRPEVDLPQNIVETEVSVRSKVTPPLNILKCVAEALKTHRLIVTIPWVVKFLGMMDNVSCTLPVYQTVLQILFHLYSKLRREGCENLFGKNLVLPSQTVLLLRLTLGWLFEAPFIQESLFYSWCFNLDESLLMMTLDLGEASFSEHSFPALDSSDILSISSNSSPPVDALKLVDCGVLYSLCPFLLELRVLLTSTRSECAPGGSVRHITPVSTSLLPPPSHSSLKQIELKLEDSFFHGLPPSVYRTVEFVVERVTSSCVKQICNVWLPTLKQKGVLQLQGKIESYRNEEDLETSPSVRQSDVKKEIAVIVDQVAKDLKEKCNSNVGDFCSTKCKGALLSLLPEESLSLPVCEMCVNIASRMSEERVITWLQNHATLSLYSKDLLSVAEKSLKSRDRGENIVAAKTSHIAPGASASWKHDDSVPSPSDLLPVFKLMVCDVLDGQEVSRQSVNDILDNMEQCVTKRQDVVPAAERVFALLSVDLVVALVCHKPLMVDSALLCRLISLWKLKALRPVEDGLARLVCPRNMLLLAQSTHPTRLVWEKLAEVVAAVLKANLVTPDLVENQCLAIMQQEWPKDILRCFAMCMNEVVRQYQKQRDVDYKFVLLLEWLAETTAQM